MTRTQAPVLKALIHLPEGYQYDYGYVYPTDMFTGHLKDPSYRKLADDLIRQFESPPEGGRLFIQKLNWDKADFSLARYVKGKNYVNVTATRLHQDSKLTISLISTILLGAKR